VYVFSGSKVIAEYANGSLSKEYVYSGAQLLATIAGATTTYHHADHLSVRISTNASGSKIGDQGHFPFGETWYLTNSTTKWQLTGYERDAESGNDYAMARYDINRVGRFSSPDLLAGFVGDPQLLNKYAYVRNDPLNAVDPLGLELCWGSCDEEWGGSGFSLNPALGPGDVMLDGSPVSAAFGQVALDSGAGVWGPATSGFAQDEDGNMYAYHLTLAQVERTSGGIGWAFLPSYPTLSDYDVEVLGLSTTPVYFQGTPKTFPDMEVPVQATASPHRAQCDGSEQWVTVTISGTSSSVGIEPKWPVVTADHGINPRKLTQSPPSDLHGGIAPPNTWYQQIFPNNGGDITYTFSGKYNGPSGRYSFKNVKAVQTIKCEKGK
jgi:RHS repeat-associated protein